MLTRRTILPAAAFALFATPAVKADPSAVAFVADIYGAYKGKDAKGRPLDNAQTIRRYFEPSLAALMIKDQKIAAKRGEVGSLDGDPFIDAQDWDASDFDVAVSDTSSGKARATVKFTNLGKPTVVALDLVKIKNDWRIHDITWMRDGKPQTLRGIYVR